MRPGALRAGESEGRWDRGEQFLRGHLELDRRRPAEHLTCPSDVWRDLGLVDRKASKTFSLGDPERRMTVFASSRSVNSFGLPMFTGRCSSLIASRSPSIRSST